MVGLLIACASDARIVRSKASVTLDCRDEVAVALMDVPPGCVAMGFSTYRASGCTREVSYACRDERCCLVWPAEVAGRVEQFVPDADAVFLGQPGVDAVRLCAAIARQSDDTYG